ncbi:MAG: hypothetical protein ABI433_05930 [Burkholderiaceae bacterium]
MAGGITGGLLRAGVVVPMPFDSIWLGHAVVAHAFLMMCSFMGTVIGIERAVAVKLRTAFVAPAASGTAGVLMLLGWVQPAAWLAVLASTVFIAVNVLVWVRQRAPHTALLLAGADAWLIGNLLLALGARPAAIVPWWFCFLVFTIAAERLEMTRLMRRHRSAPALLYSVLGAMLVGAAAFSLSPQWGGWIFGLSLLGLALWLVSFDIARKTIAAHGLSRYMAVCLLLGYAWLGVSGLAWAATSAGFHGRDMALHALALGFIFSMMLGHAPVILPALARIKLLFGWPFYVSLAALHGSLVLRLFWGAVEARAWSWGATGNAVAVLLFALTVVSSAIAWRFKYRNTLKRLPDEVAAQH